MSRAQPKNRIVEKTYMKTLMDSLFVMKWFGEKRQMEKVRDWNVKTSSYSAESIPKQFSGFQLRTMFSLLCFIHPIQKATSICST
jgi:hypothetical protein